MDPLATLFPWIATAGILGVLAVTLLERLVPVLPTAALLVTLGVAAAEDPWSFPMAFWLAMAGSLIRSLSFYGIGLALGETRPFAGLQPSAKLFGIAEAQLGRWIVSARRHEALLTFGGQLIPSVRLISPAVAGLLRVNFTRFIIATSAGAALWNSLFLGLGYLVVLRDGGANVSGMTAKVILFLLVSEILALVAWRALAGHRRSAPAADFSMSDAPAGPRRRGRSGLK
jgi:membrane protein DedA with SNARE-associated domain